MVRKLQTNPNYYPKYTMTTIGDSQTDYTSAFGISALENWTKQASNRLNVAGALTKSRAFGASGTTLAQFIGRADVMFMYDTPAIGMVFGGVNDSGANTAYVPAITGTATAGASTSITLQSNPFWTAVGAQITITGGTGVGQTKIISAINTTTLVATVSAWGTIPDNTSTYSIVPIASAGTANTITLLANATTSNNAFVGNVITLAGGTGSGQSKTIIAYNGVSRIATVDSNWSTNPDATTTYTIAITTQAAMQASAQALVKCLKYHVTGYGVGLGAGCSFWYPSMLPATGTLGQRFVIMNDNSTTGGVAANQPGQNPTITGDFSSAPQQTVWEWRNSQAGVLGWGRVAVTGTTPFSDGVSKIILVTQAYLNWSAGSGDDFNVTANTGTKYSLYVPVRAAITAAATAESVALCDLWAYESMLIYGGTFLGNTITPETTQNSFTWHVADQNIHHNKYGHEILARAIYYTVAAQSGWLAALSS